MEVVERKRSRGGFLNLFDWPGKSRKKLFSSTTSSVLSVNLNCKLDLKAIALQARNAEYNPKFLTVQSLTEEGLLNLCPYVATMAEIEGLDAHKRAVTLILKDIEAKQLSQAN